MSKHVHTPMLIDQHGKTLETLAQHNDISMSYKSPGTLLARQVMTLGLALIEDKGAPSGDDGDYNSGLVSVFTIDDLEELGIGKNEKDLGGTLSSILNRGGLVHQWVILQPNDQGTIALVSRSRYDYRTGKIYIMYDYNSKSKLINFKGNYTMFKISMLAEFNEEAAINLYEYLYSKFCEDLWKERDPEIADVTYEYTLHVQELRFIIGMDNLVGTNRTQNDKLFKELTKGNPDFEKVESIIQGDKKNDRWNHFKNRVLNPALEDIASLTDCPIKVTATGITSGGTRKITHVKFTVSRNKEVELYSRAVSAEELRTFCEGRITRTEATRLLIAAKDDLSLLKKAYSSIASKSDVQNVAAYIRKMISGGFGKDPDEQGHEAKGSVPPVKKAPAYSQRSYTDDEYTEIEKRKLRESGLLSDSED